MTSRAALAAPLLALLSLPGALACSGRLPPAPLPALETPAPRDDAPAAPTDEADAGPLFEARDGGAQGGDAGPTSAHLVLDVFAPFASRVAVAGTFNGWSTEQHTLVRDEAGAWRGVVQEAVPGDAYKLVVDGTEGRVWRNDPRALEVTSSVGDSLVVDRAFPWTDEGFSPAPWNEAVVYEMHVGTFVDEEGGAPGTFDRAIERLDHLAALGVTHVEVMPVAEFAGDFSWGYNPAHPFAVEQAYGGPRAFKRFVDAAHARGIAVLLDVVYNHLGPSDLDLWRFDSWYEGEGGGAYFYNDWRAETPWGHTRPDYGRTEIRRFLRDNARFWLTEYHLDGLRLDSTGNVRARSFGGGGDIEDGFRLLQEINDDADALPRWRAVVAEDLAGWGGITRATAQGGAGFDAQWDASFVHPVRAALVAVSDEDRSMASVRAAIAERVDDDPFGRVVYTESHDEVANGRARVPEEIWPGDAASLPSRRRATLGVALVLTTPGVPMLFQGQEFLEDGFFQDTDPLDWSKAETNADVLSVTRDLVRLRRNLDGNTRGLTGPHVSVHHVNDADKVLAFHRFAWGGPGDDVVVVASFTSDAFPVYEVGFPRCGAWTIRRATSDDGESAGQVVHASATPRDGMPCSAAVPLPPYSAVVLSQDG